MSETGDTIALAYLALAVFAEDGTLDMRELDALLAQARRDNKVTDQEKRILANVFDRIGREDVATDVWDRIQSVRRQYEI